MPTLIAALGVGQLCCVRDCLPPQRGSFAAIIFRFGLYVSAWYLQDICGVKRATSRGFSRGGGERGTTSPRLDAASESISVYLDNHWNSAGRLVDAGEMINEL